MSTAPDNEFDLEKLFLPAWAQEPSSAKYAQYEGREEERSDRPQERRGRPHNRRAGGPGPRRPEGRDDRRGPRRSGEGRGRFGEGDRRRTGREQPREGRPFPDRRERREPPPPLPDLNVALIPDDKGVESLSRQIKMTGRAYPLFEIAQMILQKPERHAVTFSVKKNPQGQPIQPLFLCALDDTLWLSEDEAVAHVLRKHFGTFYQAERTPTEPPKGKYTFVAQCSLSGVILGPPNYHDYQNQLRKLHAERFSKMPFEVYKSRVRIVRDEEVVKKWIDDQSYKTEYLCLNMPEPLRLGNMEAVEKHFREQHKENIIKPVEAHTLSGTASRALRSPQLLRLVRQVWEDQRRFPLQIATVLSQQFASHGLQFFKVNKTITHVSVARPHYLDMEATPVSEGVRHIVEYINAHPKCTRRQLVEAISPSPAVTGDAAAAGPETAERTPEQTAVIADLHWLIHQGHVIEFANGTLETAKKPIPRPPKPEVKPAEAAGLPGQAPAESSPVEPEPAPGPPGEAPLPSSEAMHLEPGEPQQHVPAIEQEPAAPVLPPAPETGKQEFVRPSDTSTEGHAPVPEDSSGQAPESAPDKPEASAVVHPE